MTNLDDVDWDAMVNRLLDMRARAEAEAHKATGTIQESYRLGESAGLSRAIGELGGRLAAAGLISTEDVRL